MSSPETIRVAAAQMEPKLGKLELNLGRILSGIEKAAEDGAKLVVFPECALSGYCFASRADGLAHAVPGDGPEVGKIAEVARRTGCGCVFGLLERDGTRLFNACFLVGPDGLKGVYRKVHLPFLGIDMFVDPGDLAFAVHEVNGLKIGMQICYDGTFPEVARVQTLLGADLLVLPTNWPTHSECAAEHLIPARAMENTVYMMAVDRVGVEDGFRFIGLSSIVDPSGKFLAQASAEAEEMLFADIDPARAATSIWSVFPAVTRSTGSPIAVPAFMGGSSNPTAEPEPTTLTRLTGP